MRLDSQALPLDETIKLATVADATLAFVISLDDVVITGFVKSGGQETLPTHLLGQVRRGMAPEINAVSTLLLAFSILVVTASYLLTRPKS